MNELLQLCKDWGKIGEQKYYVVFHQTMDGQRGEASPKQSAKKVKNGTNPAGLVPLKKVGFLGAVPLELKL